MKALEACYEFDFHKIEFLERKQRITHPKTILYGPPKCGKSYLIYDYLSHFKNDEYLYIDCNDYRNTKEDILINLEDFIKENSIKVLILENLNFEVSLPNCDSIIITSNLQKKFSGFKSLQLMPLDFEEFLLHDSKHQNITHSFNAFLKYGNLPEIIHYDEYHKNKRTQEIIKLYTQNHLQEVILRLFFENIDEKKSIHQLFTLMKKQYKISKDKFYEYCKIIKENNLIFFIPKYNQDKATKKIYSYNHALLNVVSHNKKFKNEFTNLVFLELNNRYENIFYLDNIDFYIPQEKLIILVLPFFNKLLINSIKKRISHAIDELKINKIQIITVGNDEILKINKCEVTVLPFYEWAVLN